MKQLPFLLTLSLAAASLLLAAPAAPAPGTPNTLTEAERAQGWKLLFDGKTTHGWRGFRQSTVPAEWQVIDGALVLAKSAEPGQPGSLGVGLMTEEAWSDFELQIDWKIAPGANSGIFYRLTEDGTQPNQTGVEMQILDNERHPDAKNGPLRQAGACYQVYPAVEDATRPVGEWNHARLLVKGNHVEHWLNDVKVVEYELGSEDWKARVAVSKYKNSPMYGRMPKGHLLLQDHSHHVEFRNIKLREL